jgi:FkbM family methyltransferase
MKDQSQSVAHTVSPPEDMSSRSTVRRFLRFARKPFRQQYRSLASRVQSRFPSIPIPVRLPFGAWYLVCASDVDIRILFDGFELSETRFIEKYLQPGMVVLDVGAHHGFYSLMACKATRSTGIVHSFEPAPRERACLRRNLRLNGCKQVSVHELALGASRGTATLFQAQTRFDGLNSLRPQEEVPSSTPVQVDVIPLDQFLKDHNLRHIDFIKMDIEGAELSVLQGAAGMLGSTNRPVIFAEVSDLRTKAWGYRAVEILRLLESMGFCWFEPDDSGWLHVANTKLDFFDQNFVAVAPEKMDRIRPFLRGSAS